MNTLDIVLLTIAVIAFIRGIMKGAFRQFVTLTALILSSTFASLGAERLVQNISVLQKIPRLAAIPLVFFGVWMLIYIIVKIIGGAIINSHKDSLESMSIVNRLIGGGISLAIWSACIVLTILTINAANPIFSTIPNFENGFYGSKIVYNITSYAKEKDINLFNNFSIDNLIPQNTLPQGVKTDLNPAQLKQLQQTLEANLNPAQMKRVQQMIKSQQLNSGIAHDK